MNEVIDFNVVYRDNQSFRLSVVVCWIYRSWKSRVVIVIEIKFNLIKIKFN